jgi:hypothetical protein
MNALCVPEWMTLLLVVPAILLPVALLVGFAACDRVFGLDDIRPSPPIIDSVTGTDAFTITVVWERGGGLGFQSFQLERTGPTGAEPAFDVSVSPFVDTGRDPATLYSYRVRGLDSSGEPGDWSAADSDTTLPVASAYAKTLPDSSTGWQGFTLVQRIEFAHLAAAGPNVRITVQASPAGDASIDKVYISQANSAGKKYDSAPDLTAVYDLNANQGQPFVVPAGMAIPLPVAAYPFNRFQPLLIAIDFSVAPASSIAQATVTTSEASVFYLKLPMGEAASATRSDNYAGVDPTPNPFVMLVTNIEVG